MKLKNIGYSVGFALTLNFTSKVYAEAYQPEALNQVINRVEDSAKQGHKPVVIFDLDDTLINTKERNLRILKDFAAQVELRAKFPREAALTEKLKLDQVRYQLADTLKGIAITNEEYLKAASDFWLQYFFSDQYCANDRPNVGAARFVQQVAHAGATVVYLTGRDIPRMEAGTRSNLRNNFFPMTSPQVRLMMKPDAKLDDLLFKQQAATEIGTLGEVVAVFENEPANLNALIAAFPQSTGIFLDTIHSAKLDVPAVGAHWVKNFRHSSGQVSKPYVCKGNDGADSSFELRLIRNANGTASAEIDESWGDGEELDEDTVKLTMTETGANMVYTQAGISSKGVVEGVVLRLSKTHSGSGRLTMKQAPAGRNTQSLTVAVLCE